MYITINNIKGEKRIDLSYSIQNFDSIVGRGEASKKIAVIRMSSDNVEYEMLKLPISNTKKMIQVELLQAENYSPCLKGWLNLTNLKLMITLLRRIS